MTQIDRRKALTGTVAFGLGLGLGTKIAVAQPAPAPALEVYARTPMIDKIALSPDGTKMAYISQTGDEKFLAHLNLSELKPSAVKLGVAKIRDLLWGDNEHLIVVQSVTTELTGLGFRGFKDEYNLARSFNIKNFSANTLFEREKGYYSVVFGDVKRVKIDGTYRVIAQNFLAQLEDNSSNIKNSNQAKGDVGTWVVFNFRLEPFKGYLQATGTTQTTNFVFGPDGRMAAFADFEPNEPMWKLKINQAKPGESSAARMVYQSKIGLNHPHLVGLGSDEGSVVAFISDADGAGEFYQISQDGTVSSALDAGNSDDHAPLFHPTTWKLAGFLHTGEWPSYDYFDPLLQKLTQALPGLLDDGDRWRIVDFAEDPRKFILYVEGRGDSGNYYFVDFTTGDANLIQQNYPAIPRDWVTQKQAIDYKAADGLNIHAYLTLPPYKPAQALPLVVMPHGGPEARDDMGFDWQAQALASRGYAVLQPNFRGSTGYGIDFVNAGHGEWGRKMQTDLSDGVRHLVAKGIVDPKRVAIMGASYGGYAALAGATLDPGIYNCAISIAGISHIDGFINAIKMAYNFQENTPLIYFQRFLGDPKGYDDISPAKQASKASCPILLIHGEDDTVVPIDQSQRMNSALKAAGKPVEFITYKGQDHWETIESARIRMITAAVEFLSRYNPA
jgi:dipeptidyl aminopeptidase/acylaminoacyl peptidase